MMTTWLNRIVLALLWIAVTAGVAFLVARAAGDEALAFRSVFTNS